MFRFLLILRRYRWRHEHAAHTDTLNQVTNSKTVFLFITRLLSRNIIYISNALNDFFHFGYSEAVNKFLKNHNKIEYIAALQKIRLAKYNYRTNNPIQVDISIKSISDVIYAVTNKRNAISLGGISDFSNIKPNSYEHLRLTERAIINGEVSSEDYIKKLKRHSEYSCLLRDQARKITTNLKG